MEANTYNGFDSLLNFLGKHPLHLRSIGNHSIQLKEITMAIPQLSPEERKAALEKAKAARIKRAEVREKLKAGALSVKQILDMKDDPIIGRMKVSTLIETLPGYGKAKSEKIMNELQIADSRRLRGLGERQLAALLERLV